MDSHGFKSNDTAMLLALVPPLLVRFYADGSDVAVQRLGLMVFVLGIVYGWHAVFAKRMGRPDASQLHFAMLFTVFLPGPVGWGGAALVVTFGWVFGREIFGGQNVLSPALLALAFAIFSFPDGGYQVLDIQATAPAPLLALACVPGAGLLLWKKALAWPVVVGAALGVGLGAGMMAMPTSMLLDHVILGTFSIGIFFIAAAQDCAPRKVAARWLYGALVGVLIIVIRLANPAGPDGVVFALLLATLFAPLLDRAVSWGSHHDEP